MANLVRDPKDPFSFGNKVLLDMALKKAADLTEIQYWLGVLRKRDFPREELLNLHEKAKWALMACLIKFGRMQYLERELKQFPVVDDDKVMRKTVVLMW